MRLHLLLAACALAVATPAFGQVTTDATAGSSSTSGATAGAGASSLSGGNSLETGVEVTFEAAEIPRSATLRTAPDVTNIPPSATAPCVVTHGLSVSVIGGAGGYGGGHIDDTCQRLEIVRVVGGTLNQDPLDRAAIRQYARDNLPGLDRAYREVETRQAAAPNNQQPASAPEQPVAQAALTPAHATYGPEL